MDNLTELGRRDVRKVYLITYSRADPALCGTRQDFANIVIEAFEFENGRSQLQHWVVCMEPHEGGGYHFHMAMCLTSNKRWGPAKRRLAARGMMVHFQDRQDVFNYVGAYIYVCKSDREVLHSDPHPDLSNVIQFRTAAASTANRQGRRNDRNSPQGKLTNLNVMQIIRAKDIKDEDQLLALAQENYDQGHTALMQFISNTTPKKYKELISKVWLAKDAKAKLRRRESSRMEKLNLALEESCIAECEDEQNWFNMATEVLHNNNIDVLVFAAAVRKLLQRGGSKGLNILITGKKDSAKTFILRPLTKIFDSFTNPSSGTYAFVGIQTKEVAFLNDFRYNQTMLPWQDFLNLLEGIKVHIPTPKTHYAEDIQVVSDIPFFATSINAIEYTGRSADLNGENAMMACRWREFKFGYSIPKAKQKIIPPCARCFAQLITLGIEFD